MISSTKTESSLSMWVFRSIQYFQDEYTKPYSVIVSKISFRQLISLKRHWLTHNDMCCITHQSCCPLRTLLCWLSVQVSAKLCPRKWSRFPLNTLAGWYCPPCPFGSPAHELLWRPPSSAAWQSGCKAQKTTNEKGGWRWDLFDAL